jgi:hypothetical protein
VHPNIESKSQKFPVPIFETIEAVGIKIRAQRVQKFKILQAEQKVAAEKKAAAAAEKKTAAEKKKAAAAAEKKAAADKKKLAAENKKAAAAEKKTSKKNGGDVRIAETEARQQVTMGQSRSAAESANDENQAGSIPTSNPGPSVPANRLNVDDEIDPQLFVVDLTGGHAKTYQLSKICKFTIHR